MDIVVNSNKKKMKVSTSMIVIVLVVVSLVLAYFLTKTAGKHVINKDSILVGEVQRGALDISVRGVGVLVPRDIRWVATNVDGRVERILVKAGAQVKAGDLLMVLSNPQLEQQLEETKWELEELEAQLYAQSVSLDSQLLDQETAVINERLNHNRALLTYNAQKELLSQGILAVSEIDHKEVQIEVEQYKERWDLETKRLEKAKENVAAQRKANEARITRMRKTLQRMQEQVDGLSVTATMDSIVQEMPMELGQQVGAGTNLARLAKDGDFIAELRIPEKQIQEVQLGQSVVVDTRASKIVGLVKRIDPAVINGTVQIDVELTGNTPPEARPDLSVDGVIEIAKISDTLFVKRPMYAKNFSETDVYILDENGDTAHKQSVKFGRMSTKFIQVETGLNAGESIIISDASTWNEFQQITLN